MSSSEGVIATTKLIRRIPFKEWTVVYYNPGKIDEQTLLRLIKAHRCPRAEIERSPGVLNPVIAGGDSLIVSLNAENATTLKSADLPEGWAAPIGQKLKKGRNLIAIRTASDVLKGQQSFKLTAAHSTPIKFRAEIVARVP